MEREEVKGTSSAQEQALTLEEVLDECCSTLMVMGLPPQEYWNGDYTLFHHYAEAYEKKQAEANASNYMLGLYCYRAFQSTINEMLWGIGGKKGSRPEPYLQAPIPVTEIERKAELERKKKETIEWFMKGQQDERNTHH